MGCVSTVHLRFRMLFCLLAAVLAPSLAVALELKPFKDDLFAYPGILESKDNGDWIKVDYRKERDIYQRDVEPERKVKWQYVSIGVTWHQSFDTIDMGAGRKLEIFTAGKVGKQRFSVIFIHGRGVDRNLGASDERFGGNFNRLKNIAVENGGVYVAPTVRSFDAAGAADVSKLVQSLSKTSGGNPVIIACASMGTLVCREIARDPANPLVAAELGLPFYAGVPLTTPDGRDLGTLCVLDVEPRTLAPAELATLTDLAALVVRELELRREAGALQALEPELLGGADTGEGGTIITNRASTGPIEVPATQ